MEKICNEIDRINDWVGRVLGWSIIVLNILVVLEVLLRYIFNAPTVWSFEITKQIYGFHFMICGGFALLRGSHVFIDLLHNKFKRRSQLIIDIITYIIFFFPFVIIVLYQGTQFAYNSWSKMETTWSVFQSPLYIVKTVIPISIALLLLQGFSNFIRKILMLSQEKGEV